MKYAPGLPPTDDARLREYIQKELLKISDTIDQIHLHEKSYKTPAKPQDGQVEFADGTNWNPDATNGEGLYRYDASSDTWVYLEGSGTANSPLTTKGDVWGYSTTDARIPVGSDDQVLTADSTQALGVKWATASGGFTSPLTTKGDIHTYSTTDARLPVGTDDYQLVADSGETTGLNWVPKGRLLSVSFDGSPNVNYSDTAWTTICSVSFTKKSGTSELYCIGTHSFRQTSGGTTASRSQLGIIESGGTDVIHAYTDGRFQDAAGDWHSVYASHTAMTAIAGVAAGSVIIQSRAKASATGSYQSQYGQLLVLEIET